MKSPEHVDAQQAVLEAMAASGLESVHAEQPDETGLSRAHGNVWYRLSIPGFDDLTNIVVKVPVSAKVQVQPDGTLGTVEVDPPGEEAVAEVVSFVRGLAKRGQIAGRAAAPAPPRGRATHELVTDEQGARKLIRRGFAG